jgi:hypothetical protein
MNYINRYKHQISAGMLALAAILFLDVIYQTQMHIRWRIWLPESLASESATTQPTTDSAKGAGKCKPPSKPGELHASIKKRNIFMEPKPRGHGLTLTGVLGTFALFNDRGGQTIGIEEGKNGNGITVKSINEYEVTIEYQGKTETLKLFPAVNSPGPAMPPTTMPVESVHTAGMKTVEIQTNLHRKGTTQPCTTMP